MNSRLCFRIQIGLLPIQLHSREHSYGKDLTLHLFFYRMTVTKFLGSVL